MRRTALALAISAMLSPANALVIGSADTSNSIPFGSTTGGFFYQQVYNSTNFSAPININEITFYNTVTPGGLPMTGHFDLFLSTTAEPIPTFDTSPFKFPDASFVNVFHGTLPSISDGRMDFTLSLSSFLYNPANDNLVLTVKTFDGAAVGSDASKWLFLDSDKNAGTTNARFSSFSIDFNQGLVTGFNDPAPTPLPAALPLFASGAGLIGFLGWRRKRKPA